MGVYDIASAAVSTLTESLEEFTIPSESTDASDGSKEYRWNNQEWDEQLGIYSNVPTLQVATDALVLWTMGKGYQADDDTTLMLMNITGHGKETFNSILSNMLRVYHIGGDAFAEIILDDDGNVANLKPLSPRSMVIVSDAKGRIKRYEQVEGLAGGKYRVAKTFEANQIFHLSRNRLADEVHGRSMITSLKDTIKWRSEIMSLHVETIRKHISPLIAWAVDTDDTTKINNFMTTLIDSRKNHEDIVHPLNSVVPNVIAADSRVNALETLRYLDSVLFQAAGGVDVVLGGNLIGTEGNTKIRYLSFEQVVEMNQLYVEEQCLAQLNYVIELNFPASLQNEALSSTTPPPQIEQDQAIQPNDTEMSMGGKI